MKKKNLVIVAHPDDETIWMGGTILRKKDRDWTVISLCREHDRDRRPKFEKVCERLNARAIISDLDDEKLKPLSVDEVADKIRGLLPDFEYDRVYTHGLNGEYGHIRHKEVHRAVRKLVRLGELKCKRFFSFSYKLGRKKVPEVPDLRVAVPDLKSGVQVKLNRDNFKKKVYLVKDMYGFGGQSFEVLCCNNVEAFNLLA